MARSLRGAVVALLLVLQVAGILAQSSSRTSGSFSIASSTTSSTTSAYTSTPSISLPPITACQKATFTFTAPPLPKYVAIFTQQPGASSAEILEVVQLDSTLYDNLTQGTFQWLCDWPVGAYIGFELYIPVTGSSALTGTTTTTQVLAGNDTSCYASNNNYQESTAAILSYASSLDPSYTYSKSKSTPTAGAASSSSGGHTNIVGPVVGGVIGGLAVIGLLAGLLFWLQRKQARAAALLENESRYGSDKYGPTSTYPPFAMSGVSPPPGGIPGPLWIPYDEHGNPLYNTEGGEMYPQRGVAEETPTTPHRAMVAPGTLPEPMDADAATRSAEGAPSTRPGTPPSQSSSPSNPFTPTTPAAEARSQMGSEGFDDPSSFSPMRSTHGLDDPSSFSPARTS